MTDQNNNSMLEQEKKILAEEQQILQEIKVEEANIKKLSRQMWILTFFIAALILAGGAGFWYWTVTKNQIYTDNAKIVAPTIDLAPTTSGTLEEVYVHEGDMVRANTPVARVGTELIKTKVDSEIIQVNNNIGKIFNPGQAVVTVIDPQELRVVGSIDEDKGLSSLQVGEPAVFTVDAFGSKQYHGVVDEISPTSKQEDVVFNISDKRQTQQFNVKIRFNVSDYPELKNGMSAKLWVYKN